MTDFSDTLFPVQLPSKTDAARFYRPPLPDGHVARAHLCERLQEGLSGRLLLVSAPAGFGKSSLAIEFCESLPEQWQSLWLGLSHRDVDPGRFLERLLQGLRQLYPSIGRDALNVMKMRQRHQPFPFDEWLDSVLDELAGALDSEQPLLIVLDDYHLAQGAVLDHCLQFFLSHMPGGVVVLVTSRQRPDWHLARLRLSRQMLELDEQDLRLSPAEISQLLGSHGACLPPETMNSIVQRSEGWVAGLRLWLLAASEHAGNEAYEHAPDGGQGLIRDYLLEEVIESQPAEIQAFLYDTASQERFSAALCDALRESHDSARIIDYLKAHQVFLVPLDDQGQWYRYHHLFSDLLRARSMTSPSVSPSSLHLRACRWFSGQGLLDDAIEQALRAGNPDVAASLVQSLSEEQMLGEQNVAMLLRWKMDLPESLLVSSPRLIVLYGWALALGCQLEAAQELADKLSRFLPAENAQQQKSLLAQWLALNGIIARGRGEVPVAMGYLGEALQTLEAERYGQRLLCQSVQANLLIITGDLWQARALNREALELAQRVDKPLFEALIRYDRVRMLQARGEILRALDEAHDGLQLLTRMPAKRRYAVRGRLKIFEGFLLLLRLECEKGVSCIREGIAEASACRDMGVLIGYCALANLYGRQNKVTEAFALLAEAERLMHIWDIPPIYYLAMITLIKCELWLKQGQTELAESWLLRMAQTYSREGGATPPEYHPQLPMHVEFHLASLERIQGKVDAAQKRLRQLIVTAPEMGGHLLSLFAQGQLTLLLRMSGQELEAQAQLRECVEQSSGGGLLAFSELLVHQPNWLRKQLLQLAECPVRDALLARIPQGEERVNHEQGSVETLSSREQAVLQLIAQGCSNQEISERLFISVHTVKTHARHINSKLGVERRTQAVACAKSLGLLD
ncbi:helix-turn-helix transcriptional regulator [Pseudomonas sp. J237]|nr:MULTISPECIES: LuxR C-terminal-related transcriptional regulator [Pseudomonas]OEO23739.1 helix-turn-helix transcriptional regulator [Pseudomonas sp. J237]